MMDVLTGGRNKDLHRQREEGRVRTVRTETKTGVPPPQARESQESPEARKGEEGLSPGVFGGGMALLTPWFQMLGLHNCEWINFCCFKPPSFCYGICYGNPRELGEKSLVFWSYSTNTFWMDEWMNAFIECLCVLGTIMDTGNREIIKIYSFILRNLSHIFSLLSLALPPGWALHHLFPHPTQESANISLSFLLFKLLSKFLPVIFLKIF